MIQEKYLRLKNVLGQRDCKLILILIKVGVGSLDKDIIEERLASMKRHLQFDSKSFYFIPVNEFSLQSSLILKKVSKAIREFASAYYSSQCKRIRSLEKAMATNRSVLDMILTARYNFKLGIFYEFLGQRTVSLKFYRISYDACVSAIEILDEEWTDQVETVAEYNHYKIVTILLQSAQVKEAGAQFKLHVTKFLKAYSSPWRHFAWLADQYYVYAQLLDQYKVIDVNYETDRSYYYLNAAKYLVKRQTVFENTVDVSKYPKSIQEKRNRLLASSTGMTNPNTGTM